MRAVARLDPRIPSYVFVEPCCAEQLRLKLVPASWVERERFAFTVGSAGRGGIFHTRRERLSTLRGIVVDATAALELWLGNGAAAVGDWPAFPNWINRPRTPSPCPPIG